MPTVHDHLTEQFHHWERRGRGWKVFKEPVFPEPPFQRFSGYTLPQTSPDDGRRPTFLSKLVQKLAAPPEPTPVARAIPEPQPMPFVRESIVEVQVMLPEDSDIVDGAFQHFLSNLSSCREPLAFELLAAGGNIATQFAACPDDVPLIRRQAEAHFPGAIFIERQDTLVAAWGRAEGDEALAVEFGLEREFMFPLATDKNDSFIGIVAALSGLRLNELCLFQVLWQPVDHGWAESIAASVTHADGRPFFVNSPELTAAAEKKISSPLYAAVVRILIRTATRDRLFGLARDLAASLRIFSNPQGNALIPLHNSVYPFDEHIEDVLCRQSRRSGMLLNREELLGFVHLPSSNVRSPAFVRETGKTKAAPQIVRNPPGVLIGDNEHAGQSVPVYLSSDLRSHHVHIIGKSGTGKSSLFFRLIQQDIESGQGVAVLDPHGDLISHILGIVPDNRLSDVILFDPSDDEYPIGFNILQAHSEDEKNILASDLIATFRRLSTSWGDQMDTVLQNAILVVLESRQGGTLADLRRFLIEPAFRTQFLSTVQDPELIYYWKTVFPHLTGNRSIGPVLTRLQDFFSQKRIRNMVSQKENKLDFANIMDSGKIFLAKLSTGLGGAVNSYMFGTLLVSKFQQTAMARQSQTAEKRRQFWLYIDEFDHFISPSMAEILTGARKYRMGLILAHQELHQLQSDPKVASAVLSEPSTRVVFSVGDDDAKKLAEGFESFDAKSVKTLEKFHAIVRVERNDFDFNLALRKPEYADQKQAEPRKAAIVSNSRSKYATPRVEVEASLLAKLNVEEKKPSPGKEGVPPTPKPSEPSPGAEVPKPTVSEKKEVLPVVPEPPTAEATPTPPATKPTISRDLGRGGEQHRAIQKRIKEAAESLGFHSVIEKQVLEGDGSVDLLLERVGTAIACEISITTTVDHEVGNVAKCLKAGLPKVAVICLDEDRLKKIEKAIVGSLGKEVAARVEYFQPDPFIAYLKTLKLPPALPSEGEVGGYRVKRSAPTLSAQEQKQKEDVANKIMADALRRKKQ